MHGQGIDFRERGQPAVRRAAGAHVIFGVDLEKSDIGPRRHNLRIMLRLQPSAERATGKAPNIATDFGGSIHGDAP